MADEDPTSLEKPAVLPTPAWAAKPAARMQLGVQINTPEEFEALAAGTKFRDPDGKSRIKPYQVSEEGDFWKVPEGAPFLDPEGALRTRPKYEGVAVTTQTLYDMAANDRERRKVLERGYPGAQVLESPEGLYVKDKDVLRKPGRGMSAAVGHVLAEAAPAAGMIGGSLLGGTAGVGGGPAAPATVPAGAFAGGVLGAMAGRQFNNIVLSIAGVHDRGLMEDIGSVGMEGAAVAGGEVIGRGIGKAVPLVKSALDKGDTLNQKAAAFVGELVGANRDPERTALAQSLAEKDVRVRPSAHMLEAPYLASAAEVFDVKFRAQNVLQESARGHYEKTAAGIADTLGLDVPAGGFTKARTAISVKEAGEAAQTAARERLAASDAELDRLIAERQGAARTAFEERQKGAGSLAQAAEENRAIAQRAIDQTFTQIDRDIDQALRSANANTNSGDLWEMVGQKFRELNAAFKQRAGLQYARGDAVGGSVVPPQSELSQVAQDLLNTLPGDFSSRYPHIVKQFRDLAGVVDEKGEWIKEPVEATLGQLRNLRSQLRSEIDYQDLTAGIREGVFKKFQGLVDRVIKSPDLPPEGLQAVAFYNAGDRIYAENMPIYHNKAVRAVMRGLEDGHPADPTNLARLIIKPGMTEQINRIREMVGPNLWAAVAAADKRSMMEAAKGLREGEVNAVEFAKEIMSRHKAGLLEPVHGREVTAQLRNQAEAIMVLNGKLPVQVRPGDTMSAVIAQARDSMQAAKAAARADPIGSLDRELKAIDKDLRSITAEERARDPFKFLVEPSVGAIEAADRILADPDLFIAAAARFGEKSEAFTFLRQVAAQRILQQPIEAVGRKAGQVARTTEPEVWNLIFPGVTGDQARTLAREMDFLLGPRPDVRGTGASIAAQSRVLNPWGSISGAGKLAGPVKLVPGGNTAGRAILTKYYKLLTELSTSPATVKWLTQTLDRGDPAMRAQAWDVVYRMATERGGAVGRAAGLAAGGPPGETPQREE